MEPTEPNKKPELKGFDELMNNNELTGDDLQAELAKYRQAYEEEFTESLKEAPEDADKFTKKYFRENLPEAAAQIVWLAHNAESEGVRANLLKFIINEAKLDAKADGDPIKELLESLNKKVPTP